MSHLIMNFDETEIMLVGVVDTRRMDYSSDYCKARSKAARNFPGFTRFSKQNH